MTAKYEAIQRWPISFLAKIQKERPLYIYIPNSIKLTWKKKNETHTKKQTNKQTAQISLSLIFQKLSLSAPFSFCSALHAEGEGEEEWIELRRTNAKPKIELYGKSYMIL